MTFLLRILPCVALYGLLLAVVAIAGSVLVETAYGLAEVAVGHAVTGGVV